MGKDSKKNFAVIPTRGRKETEVEDLMPFSIVRQIVENVLKIDIDNQNFKNHNSKFTDRLKYYCTTCGYELSDSDKDEIKTKVADMIESDINIVSKLDADVKQYFESVIPRIEKELEL